MNIDQVFRLLKESFNDLSCTPFPKYKDSSQISDLLCSLAELDSYYAGWALTVANGGKISPRDLHNMEPIWSQYRAISPKNEMERKILSQCYDRLMIIDRINKYLIELTKI